MVLNDSRVFTNAARRAQSRGQLTRELVGLAGLGCPNCQPFSDATDPNFFAIPGTDIGIGVALPSSFPDLSLPGAGVLTPAQLTSGSPAVAAAGGSASAPAKSYRTLWVVAGLAALYFLIWRRS